MANTLGIDIGASSVKAVVMVGPRSPDVRWVRRLERGHDNVTLTDLLERIQDEALPQSDVVVTALTGESVPVVFVDLPFTNRKLVERTVAFEVEEHLPALPENHELVFQTTQTSGQGSRVVSALAPEALIQARLAELSEAGLEPRIIDLDVLALYSCALEIPCTESVRAVVDIGATKTLVVVLDGDALIATRVIRLGGSSATQEIADALSLEPDQAESVKLSFEGSAGLASRPSADDPAESRAVHAALTRLYSELLQSVAVTLAVQERREGRTLGRVFLVGGGARVSGLAALATERLATPTSLAPVPDGAHISDEQWPEAAVAYGLARRGVRGAIGSAVNFRTGDFAYGREIKEVVRRFLPLAVPAGLILAALLVSVVARLVDRSAQVAALEARIQSTFESAFPNEPIVDVDAQIAGHRSRLESKIRLLRGPSSAAQVLADLSSAVDRSVEVVADVLLLEGNKLTLKGRTQSYETLSRVREGLEAHGGFQDVRIEEQQKTGTEVRFRITAVVGHDLEEAP